jgi:predicted metalloprotease with PDZ domain
LLLLSSQSGKLGIGISELSDGSISVSRLEDDDDGDTGPAEAAGLLVGDRLIGANYQPFRGGLTYVVDLFQAAKVMYLL